MRALLVLLGIAALVILAGMATGFINIDQTQTAQLPRLEGGQAPEFKADAPATVVPADAIPDDQMGLDIGPESQKLFAEKLATTKTVAWNGPMGVFEFPAFAGGTRAVAEALSTGSMFSVVGGGDSAAAVRLLGFDESTFSHISTGDDASLKLLEGKVLPGITVLKD